MSVSHKAINFSRVRLRREEALTRAEEFRVIFVRWIHVGAEWALFRSDFL